MDCTYRERHGEAIYRMLPSDFFHRNVVLSFQEDAIGIRLRDVIGVDNKMWGSDYTHRVRGPPLPVFGPCLMLGIIQYPKNARLGSLVRSSDETGSCSYPPTSPEWSDPITEAIMTQMLPFADEKVLGFDAWFERGLYGA
jgi:hypothetical protein